MNRSLPLAVSLLADGAMILPLAAVLLVWVAIEDWSFGLRWLFSLVCAFAMVLVSKMLWTYFHYEIPVVSFRMISGHMVLAFSIWPALLGTTCAALRNGCWSVGRIVGYLLCIIIGLSRLAGAHTVAEVLAGALIGVLVEKHFASEFKELATILRKPTLVALLIIIVICIQYGDALTDVWWIKWIVTHFSAAFKP